jgi:hypothetical protein
MLRRRQNSKIYIKKIRPRILPSAYGTLTHSQSLIGVRPRLDLFNSLHSVLQLHDLYPCRATTHVCVTTAHVVSPKLDNIRPGEIKVIL